MSKDHGDGKSSKANGSESHVLVLNKARYGTKELADTELEGDDATSHFSILLKLILHLSTRGLNTEERPLSVDTTISGIVGAPGAVTMQLSCSKECFNQGLKAAGVASNLSMYMGVHHGTQRHMNVTFHECRAVDNENCTLEVEFAFLGAAVYREVARKRFKALQMRFPFRSEGDLDIVIAYCRPPAERWDNTAMYVQGFLCMFGYAIGEALGDDPNVPAFHGAGLGVAPLSNSAAMDIIPLMGVNGDWHWPDIVDYLQSASAGDRMLLINDHLSNTILTVFREMIGDTRITARWQQGGAAGAANRMTLATNSILMEDSDMSLGVMSSSAFTSAGGLGNGPAIAVGVGAGLVAVSATGYKNAIREIASIRMEQDDCCKGLYIAMKLLGFKFEVNAANAPVLLYSAFLNMRGLSLPKIRESRFVYMRFISQATVATEAVRPDFEQLEQTGVNMLLRAAALYSSFSWYSVSTALHESNTTRAALIRATRQALPAGGPVWVQSDPLSCIMMLHHRASSCTGTHFADKAEGHLAVQTSIITPPSIMEMVNVTLSLDNNLSGMSNSILQDEVPYPVKSNDIMPWLIRLPCTMPIFMTSELLLASKLGQSLTSAPANTRFDLTAMMSLIPGGESELQKKAGLALCFLETAFPSANHLRQRIVKSAVVRPDKEIWTAVAAALGPLNLDANGWPLDGQVLSFDYPNGQWLAVRFTYVAPNDAVAKGHMFQSGGQWNKTVSDCSPQVSSEGGSGSNSVGYRMSLPSKKKRKTGSSRPATSFTGMCTLLAEALAKRDLSVGLDHIKSKFIIDQKSADMANSAKAKEEASAAASALSAAINASGFKGNQPLNPSEHAANASAAAGVVAGEAGGGSILLATGATLASGGVSNKAAGDESD